MVASSFGALDLAADAAALLQAAEVALLVQRHRETSQQTECGMPRAADDGAAPGVTSPAMVWRRCLSRAFLQALIMEAKMLVRRPGGGWTHWLQPTSAPRCALEALALATLRFHLTAAEISESRAGVEWWVQVRDMDESMPLHWDCDEALYDRTGEHAAPFLATVTYVTSGGAPTIVLPVATDARGCPMVEPQAGSFGDGEGEGGDGDGAYACFPVAGSHLAFDGRLLHGTQHEGVPWSRALMTSYADALDQLARPQRVTLLVNLWLAHRPDGVGPLTAETADALWSSHAAPTCGADGQPAALAAAAYTTAEAAPAVRVGDAASVQVRQMPIGRFHERAPIGVQHLDNHLSRPPAPNMHFVRVAEARALLHPP